MKQTAVVPLVVIAFCYISTEILPAESKKCSHAIRRDESTFSFFYSSAKTSSCGKTSTTISTDNSTLNITENDVVQIETLIIKRYDNNDDLLTPDGRRLNENETSWCGLYSKVSRAKCKSMERLDNCNPEIRIADTWPPRITAKGSFMAIISFRVWKCFVYTTSEKTNTPAPKQENTTSTSEPIIIIIIVLGISLGISVVVIVLLIRKFICLPLISQDTVENPPTINNNPAAMNENEYETESPENGHEFRSQETDAIYSTAHNFSTNDQLPIYASANDPVSSSEMVNNVLYQQYRARETN